MARPWTDLLGSVRGATPRNVFAPFGNSAIISYHSVNFVIQPYLSVSFAIVVYQVAAFQTSVFVCYQIGSQVQQELQGHQYLKCNKS